MGNFLETIYDVLFKPRSAMQYIAEKKLTGQALVIFTIGMLVPVWALYTGVPTAAGVSAFSIFFGLNCIGSFICWVLGAAVLNLAAEFAGGRGTAMGLFAALGFAHLPRIAVMPLWVIAALLPAGLRGVAIGVTGLIAVGWTLTLHVAAIRGAHGLSAAKAILVLLAPLLVLLSIVAAVFVFLSSTLMHLPFQF